ncbi:hypothetical protein yc1106_06343 [Curvularia clavata]|uniref:Aquaporin-like protein n=1 Tax=Curvularia clavata TaxID=95742 RepID=A0A9Q8ZCS3_CURCL|nr:hypothetical protein yc1106_06343 [Curvularia clavata]
MLRTSIIKSARSIAAPRYFSASALRLTEGATGSGTSRPTGTAGGDAFTKREAAAEELYIRQEEKAKLMAIKEKLKQQRQHMDELDKHIDEVIKESEASGQGEQKLIPEYLQGSFVLEQYLFTDLLVESLYPTYIYNSQSTIARPDHLMSRSNSTFRQFYTRQLPDGSIVESPTPLHDSSSGDSRQELLRTPVQGYPARHDARMEPEIPAVPPLAPSRARRSSQSVPVNPSNHPVPSVEEYPEEEERNPQAYQYRTNRRHTRPPVSYGNFPEQSARYGPMPRNNWDVNAYPAYADMPGKPNYEMYYPYYQEAYGRYPAVSDNGGRGPPPPMPSAEHAIRLPWMIWMGSNAKNHFVAFVGEFVGTTMFLFFAFSGTQVANIRSAAAPQSNTTTGEAAGFSPIVLLYIALVFAFSLMVNVWVFFRISGGLFNPAVTFAMLLCRALSPIRAFLLFAAQMAGSIFASFLVKVLFPTNFNVRTTLGQGTSLAQGTMIEAVLTAELVFTIFMLAKEKHKATFIAPVGIGLALFIGELVGVYYTGGSLNPARSFGPCVVTGVFDKDHWIYWVGPGVGAILALLFYQFIKILEYEVANPGQDDDGRDQDNSSKDDSEKREGSLDPELGNAPGPGPGHVLTHSASTVPLATSASPMPLSAGGIVSPPPASASTVVPGSVMSPGVARSTSRVSAEGKSFGGKSEKSV